MIIETDPRTRLELYLALARLAPSDAVATALVACTRMENDPALLDPGRSPPGRSHRGTGQADPAEKEVETAAAPNLLPNPDSETTDGKPPG